MAARLTRAKARLAAGGPALDLPDDATVDARLPTVARVVHLAFTLGHTISAGKGLTDEDLADHAQYLASVLHRLRPAVPAFTGLLALVVLTRARGAGRFSDDGAQVLLEDADRSRWDRAMIDRGLSLLNPLLDLVQPDFGSPDDPMVLQASISAAHSVAPTFAATDWAAVVGLYSRLLQVDPSPSLALGRCVALSYLRGPLAGLRDLDGVLASGALDGSPYAAAARATMLDRLGRAQEAAGEWREAAGRARTDAEREWFGARAANARPRTGLATRPGPAGAGDAGRAEPDRPASPPGSAHPAGPAS